MMNEPEPCNKLDLFLVRIQLALVVGAGTAFGFCRAEETNDDNDPQKENSVCGLPNEPIPFAFSFPFSLLQFIERSFYSRK
ncbi:hypothetical protein LguiA_001990 [Lonicera macranthoides]